MPQPRSEDPLDGPLHDTRPLLAVVPTPSSNGTVGSSKQPAAQQHCVRLYSLRTQGYVKTLTFSSEVLSVLCSSRVLVVALKAQLQAFDAVTLEHTFSCLTHCPPPSRQPLQPQQQAVQPGHEGQDAAPPLLTSAPCALGPRWLAYAADQVRCIVLSASDPQQGKALRQVALAGPRCCHSVRHQVHARAACPLAAHGPA